MSAGRPERRLCDHCGLPAGALTYSTHEGACYCCYGCQLASMVVGRREGGAPAWVLARLGVGAFLAMNVMMVSLVLYSGELQDLGEGAESAFRWGLLGLSTPALIVLGAPFVAGMARELRRIRPSLDSLIAIGSVSAYGVSAVHVVSGKGPIYFDTATMLLVLVTVGRLLEASAKTKAASLVRGLLAMRPPTARVLRGTGETTVPAEEVGEGEHVRVGPGERFPVDAVVLRGRSSVQEASFTGEPGPRPCGPGSRVFGGSVNVDGEMVVEARGVAEGSLVAQIVRLAEESAARRAPVERLAERVSAAFIPAVLLAAGGALLNGWRLGEPARGGMSALAVLVVACPCALGLATPLVTCLAIGRAAREGVLVRSGETLEELPRVSRVFLDKTGTLTRGVMQVVSVEPFGDSADADHALAWLATLESAGEHPVARAIVAEAESRGLSLGQVETYRAHPGEGAVGTVALGGERREIVVGTPAFVCPGVPEPSPTDDGQFIYASSRSPLWRRSSCSVGSGPNASSRPFLRVRLSDTLRPEAREAIAQLRQQGLRVTLLSGDRVEAARAVAREAGIEEVVAPCLPDGKIAAIRAAKAAGQAVAMVGDGLNDAPALTEANVGFAMASGADLAREGSDVTLLGDQLERLPWVIGLARGAYRTIAWNLAWAFGYNAIAIAVAFLGYLHPLLAVLVMLGSSAFVLGNSLRIAGYPGPGSVGRGGGDKA